MALLSKYLYPLPRGPVSWLARMRAKLRLRALYHRYNDKIDGRLTCHRRTVPTAERRRQYRRLSQGGQVRSSLLIRDRPGNEPNRKANCTSCTSTKESIFKSNDPIAHGESWAAAVDAASQISWQGSVNEGLGGEKSFLQAGVFFDTELFTSESLAAKEEKRIQRDTCARSSIVFMHSRHRMPILFV